MNARTEVVDPGVLRIVLPGGAAHAYLFLGKRTALVDCGSTESRPALAAALRKLDVPRAQISVVVLTHEHASHAGGADLFPDALLVAHSLAAAKLRHRDEAQTKLSEARAPDIELEAGGALRLGGFSFDVVHTAGHTSGSICLYERSRALIVTGDTVFARGALPAIAGSGSMGEHLESLERLASLRARMLLPGHGPVSDDPVADLAAAAAAARLRLRTGKTDSSPLEELTA